MKKMKRILFVCCLLAATCTVTYTQSYAQSSPTRPTVSKADFTAKVAQLKTLLDAGNAVDGKAKWEEVHKMMLSALGVTKYKIKDAIDAHNDVDKAHYTDVTINQRNLYYDIVKMRNDLVANRVSLNTKLTAFGATIE